MEAFALWPANSLFVEGYLTTRGDSLADTYRMIREVKQRYPIGVCLSVGLLEEEHARILADAGLDRLNHNLNTSE